jgi:tetratricopeptide (TPR) repeat protein
MKFKFLSSAVLCLLCVSFVQAQDSATTVNCGRTLQIFAQNAKIKDYKSAMPQYGKLVDNCPKESYAIYQYGERMFNYFLDKEAEKSKVDSAKVKKLAQQKIKNNELRLKNYPEKVNAQEIAAENAQIMFDYKMGTKAELYKKFDKAWKMSDDGYTNPKPLYAYYRLLLELYNQGDKDLQLVFDRYDALSNKVKKEQIKQADKKEPIIKKQESGAELTTAEERTLHNADIYLKNYNSIQNSLNSLLGDLSDCENLIPLYKKQLVEKKDDTAWLKRAAGRLSQKECADSDIFFTIVENLHNKNPSAKTAFYLGQLAQKKGNRGEALDYFKQSAELETNKLDKARVYNKLGNYYKGKGSYSSARSFYRKTLDLEPSMGSAYLNIAEMYAKSVNNCGADTFSKRAVYWLAANYASRAAQVDLSLKDRATKTASSYRGRAPSKKDIFQSDYKEGQAIKIGCWIGESVTVPAI